MIRGTKEERLYRRAQNWAGLHVPSDATERRAKVQYAMDGWLQGYKSAERDSRNSRRAAQRRGGGL